MKLKLIGGAGLMISGGLLVAAGWPVVGAIVLGLAVLALSFP